MYIFSVTKQRTTIELENEISSENKLTETYKAFIKPKTKTQKYRIHNFQISKALNTSETGLALKNPETKTERAKALHSNEQLTTFSDQKREIFGGKQNNQKRLFGCRENGTRAIPIFLENFDYLFRAFSLCVAPCGINGKELVSNSLRLWRSRILSFKKSNGLFIKKIGIKKCFGLA